jgi:hypothetical protein
MKASEYGKPQDKKENVNGLTSLQKTILLSIILIGIFTIIILKSRPSVLPKNIIEKELTRLVKKDSSIANIPINYKYEDNGFVSNGDTTYWFFEAIADGDNNYSLRHTKIIQFPYSHFDFYKAAEYLKIKDKKAKTIFIVNFIQISKASYINYKKYCDTN